MKIVTSGDKLRNAPMCSFVHPAVDLFRGDFRFRERSFVNRGAVVMIRNDLIFGNYVNVFLDKELGGNFQIVVLVGRLESKLRNE